MKINTVSFKNFASYGNKTQTVNFSKKEADLYLVFGANGSGKSTIANVIKFLLYGKVDGINLTDLPNRINKSLWGKIDFNVKNTHLEIERGMRPNIFKVFINGVEYDQAGKLNVQDYLEKEFYDIPFHVFKNIIILSVNDFKSFLFMSPSDKKMIVDKIFGFSIINEMREALKQEKKSIESDIAIYEKELGMITESITSINAKLNELEKTSTEKDKRKINELKTKLLKLNENKKLLKDAKGKIDKKVKDAENIIEKHKGRYNKLQNRQNEIVKKTSLYKNKQCPECESDLSSDFHKKKLQLFLDEYSINQKELDTLENTLLTKKKDFIKNRDNQHKVISKISTFDANMLSFKNELIEIVNKGKNDQFKYLDKLVQESKEKEQKKYKDKLEYGDKLYFLKIVDEVLGEEGIKNVAMKMILPTLNKMIADLLRTVHLHFKVFFDNKFDPHITSLGEEINAKTLSTGEKKKLDFIIIIALIKMMKIRYPGLNILFLDEIFSSIDADGIYSILRVLNETIKDIDLNTFVINHTVLPTEIFDKKIEIFKKHGFSNLEVSEIK